MRTFAASRSIARPRLPIIIVMNSGHGHLRTPNLAAFALILALAGALVLSGCAHVAKSGNGGGASHSSPRVLIAGLYSVGGSGEHVRITALGGDRYRADSPGLWEGVGIFDGHTYWGVFRYPNTSHHASLANVCGLHRAEVQPDRSFKVHGSFNSSGFGEFDIVWNRVY